MKRKLWYLTLFIMTTLFVQCSTDKNLVGTQDVQSMVSATKWIHIQTIDATTKEDVTAKYPQFAGIGQYNEDGSYEFFTADNKPKGDKGKWLLTDSNTVMKISSSTFGYTVSPKLMLVNKTHLTFRITVKDNTGKDLGDVIAIHIPYKD